jgi:small subunit ribosomal protein S1
MAADVTSHDDSYKQKFRPDQSALDKEVDAALAGMSLDELYAYDKPKAEQAAPGSPEAAAQAALAARGLRRGKVVSVTKDDVFLDLAGKSPGVCPLIQFEAEPKLGEEYDFSVDRYDDKEGILILTRAGALNTKVSWENLEVGQVVEGTVTGVNKGGLELEVKGMRAFMPLGQIDIFFQKDVSVFIGQKMQAEVTKFEKNAKNLVLSRRAILEREKEQKRQEMIGTIEVGQMRQGTVRSIMDFGAFVDLGGIDGLIHVSEMSHRRGQHPSAFVKEGDLVDVKIIKFDKETGKLGLSLKQARPDPWIGADQRYATGMTITGRVARVESFGAFIEVEEGIEGLLPVSEMSWQRIRHPGDVVKEGDTIKLVVLQIDLNAKRLTFSLKQAGPDPWSTVKEKYAIDTNVTGKVTRLVDFGAFVELEPGLEGLVHISELDSRRVRTAGDVVKVGQEVKVRVLEIDKDARRVSLSLRRANEAVAPAAAAAAPEPAASAKKKKRPELRGGLDWGW